MNLNNYKLFFIAIMLISTTFKITTAYAYAPFGIEKRLEEKNIILPKVSKPISNYAQTISFGKLIFISAQLPMENGKLKFIGKAGGDIKLEQAEDAAILCVLNIVSQLKESIGSLNKVKACLKLSGFINSDPNFSSHSRIMDAASNMITDIFGDKILHTRNVVGVSSLPLNATMQIEAIFEVE